jgi:uncharacterized SAM-binding protein YcdF (DUF218 family)
MSRRSTNGGRTLRRLAGFATGLFLVAGLALAGGFFAFVAMLDRYAPRPPGTADAIVALTGGSQRVADAIELLSQGYGGRLLISGVNETTTRAEIARLNPGQRRLLDCCVDLDYRARNTIGNAIETRRWIADHGFGSIIVVTSNYHMPRTLLELENAAPEVLKIPHAVTPTAIDVSQWWRDELAARLLALEYLKFLAAWARTRIEDDPELSVAATLLSRADGPVKPEVSPEE